MNNKLNVQAAKEIDLVELLAALNYHPAKILGNDYWYLSPLREERTASFKVNRRINAWYDFGTGEGGNIVDFGIRFYHCSVSQLLDILGSKNFFFQPQNIQRQEPLEKIQPVFTVKEVSEIGHFRLVDYIESRGITLKTARQFCKEVILHSRKTNADFSLIGLQNSSGGWELRAPDFKSCVAPKDISFFNNDQSAVAMTEGMFDFLTAVQEKLIPENTNWLILNSLSMTEKAKPVLLQHEKVFLLLDNDKPAKICLESLSQFLSGNNIATENLSYKYALSKDINEWLMSRQMKTLQAIDEHEREQRPSNKLRQKPM